MGFISSDFHLSNQGRIGIIQVVCFVQISKIAILFQKVFGGAQSGVTWSFQINTKNKELIHKYDLFLEYQNCKNICFLSGKINVESLIIYSWFNKSFFKIIQE